MRQLLTLPSIEALEASGVSYDGTYLYKNGERCSGRPKVKIAGKQYSGARVAFKLHHKRDPVGRVKLLNNLAEDIRIENLEDGHDETTVRKLSRSNKPLPRYVSQNLNHGKHLSYLVALNTKTEGKYIGRTPDLQEATWMAWLAETLLYPEHITATKPDYAPTDSQMARLLKRISETQCGDDFCGGTKGTPVTPRKKAK